MWNMVVSFVQAKGSTESPHFKSVRENFTKRDKFPSIVKQTSTSQAHLALASVSEE